MQLSIGKPENHAPAGEAPWVTAIYRKPVLDAVLCTKLGFEGDQVADRRYHGGPDKAVLCYSAAHYPVWQQEGLVELVDRPRPEWTISRAMDVNYSRKRTLEDLRELQELPELSAAWKSDLKKKLNAVAQ